MLGLILFGVATVLALSLLVPAVRALFSFGPLHWDDLSLTLGVTVSILVVLELAKRFWRDQLRF
jgi:Ca2+-transporting ATPase